MVVFIKRMTPTIIFASFLPQLLASETVKQKFYCFFVFILSQVGH